MIPTHIDVPGDDGVVSVRLSDYSAGKHVVTISVMDGTARSSTKELQFIVDGMKRSTGVIASTILVLHIFQTFRGI